VQKIKLHTYVISIKIISAYTSIIFIMSILHSFDSIRTGMVSSDWTLINLVSFFNQKLLILALSQKM